MTTIIAARARVASIKEHSRIVTGRKNPLDPQQSFLETVNLGWFIHLDFGPESPPISFGVGNDKPDHLKEGDTVILSIAREARVSE